MQHRTCYVDRTSCTVSYWFAMMSCPSLIPTLLAYVRSSNLRSRVRRTNYDNHWLSALVSRISDTSIQALRPYHHQRRTFRINLDRETARQAKPSQCNCTMHTWRVLYQIRRQLPLLREAINANRGRNVGQCPLTSTFTFNL